MKAVIEAKTLAADVAWAAQFVPGRPLVPVVAGILLDARDGHLRVTATDMDTWASATADADTETSGAALVPGRVLAAAAAQLPAGQATLEADGPRLTITCGSARFTLSTLPLEDYPSAPARPEPLGRVDGATLAQAVAQVQAACSTSPHLPALTGIRVHLDEEGLRMVGTDGYRIAEARAALEPTVGTAEAAVLAPRRTLAAAVKAMTGAVEVGVAHDGGTATALGLSSADREVLTHLLDDTKYPAAGRRLDALTGGQTVTAPAGRLLEAVRRVASVAQPSEPVLLDIDTGEIRVRCGGSEDAQAGDVVSASAEVPVRLWFAPEYLVDMLSQVPTDRVRLLVPEGAALAVAVADEARPSYRHMVAARQMDRARVQAAA